MRIFPNPFRDRIQLENAPSNAQYSVHDVLGRTVFMSGTMPTMDLGQLSNDIYFLKVMTADRMWTFPIIKQ
jgi:hypothetical protein